MPTLYGFVNLWETTRNLRQMREDRLSLYHAVECWQAAAVVSIRETAAQFRQPAPSFQTLTELLGLAARGLFDVDIPQMRRFADLCRGKASINSRSTPFALPPSNSGEIDWSARSDEADLDEDERYWLWDSLDGTLVPGPGDLRAALEEADHLMNMAISLPPPSSPIAVEEIEWSDELKPTKGWAERFGVCRDTMRAYIRAGQVRAKKVGGKYRIAKKDLPASKIPNLLKHAPSC